MNKNIAGYCGYIGLISFVAYRPDTAWLPTRPRVSVGCLGASRKAVLARRRTGRHTSNDMLMTHRSEIAPNLTTGAACLPSVFKKSVASIRHIGG
jgi:hypothetical protein